MKKKLLILILFTATIQAMVLDSMHMKIYAECSAYGNLVDKYQTRNFLVEISNQNISWYEKENIYSLPSDSGEFQILKDDNSPHYMEFDKFTDGTYDKKPYYSINQSKGYPALEFNLRWDAHNVFDSYLKNNTLIFKSSIPYRQRIKVETLESQLSAIVDKNRKPEYEYKYEIKYKDTYYNILSAHDEWEYAENECDKQIQKDIKGIQEEYTIYTILFLIGLFISYRILKAILIRTKHKAIEAKEKIDDYKKDLEDKRIAKKVKERLIDESIERTIKNSDDSDYEDLQNMINKAVEKGDFETAQALQKILSKKKDTDKI